jgi:phosphoglycerate dehydrogenase-like enzyme
MPDPADTKLVACVRHKFDLWRFPARLAEDIRTRYPQMKVVHLPDYTRLAEEIEDADIFIGWSLRPEQFVRARKLKWIHATAAGVDQLLRDDIRRSPVIVTNASGVMTVPMAEHTLGLILALARRLPSAVRQQQQQHWAQQEIWDEEPRPAEVNGCTLTIVGYGAIGREVARRARACGMRIVGVKRHPARGTEQADRVVGVEQLDSALAEADYVVLATPVTPETRHLFDARRFDCMKKTAYLINVGRGVLVDTAALIAALREKKIAGAAIDVAEGEPLPPESPLWRAPNLLITPHVAAVSERLWERHAGLLFDNLERYFSGRELRNVVDKEKGY